MRLVTLIPGSGGQWWNADCLQSFIANSLGLDFLNSIATPVDTPVDWLDSGDGLLTVAGSSQACSSGRCWMS